MPVVWNADPPSASRISRPVHRIRGSRSSRSGRVLGCQVRSRYCASPLTNAQYRDRISSSAVGALAAPEWKRPQQASYGCGSPQGQVRVLMRPIVPKAGEASAAGRVHSGSAGPHAPRDRPRGGARRRDGR
ncbi:hypothetical protein SGPA1_20133 [Streptomyces misionensis JCM 4497]